MNLIQLSETGPWEWPEGAGEFLAGILGDRGRALEDRVQAARLLGEVTVMNDAAAELLLSVVKDGGEAEELRGVSAISLGPVLDEMDLHEDDDLEEPPISEGLFEAIQEELRQVYEDEASPKQVRRRVLEASVRAPWDWHGDAIRAAQASDDEEWQLTAAFCMRFVPGFREEILQMVSHPSVEVQAEAIQAAGTWEVEEAWPQVEQVLENGSAERSLLLAAIEAAPRVNREEAGSYLDDWLESEDEEIAETAVEAMMEASGDLEEDWDADEEWDEEDEEEEDEDTPPRA